MRTLAITMIVLWGTTQSYSQTNYTKEFPLSGKKSIVMEFEYPELIKIVEWSGASIKIEGVVKINNGKDNDNFKIESSQYNESLKIESSFNDFESIGNNIVIEMKGKKYYFETDDIKDEKVQKFINENQGEYSYISHGPQIEISLTISIPKGANLDIFSNYGLIEIGNVSNSIKAESKFGGVDITVAEGESYMLKAGTKFGEIYSNLNSEFIGAGNSLNPYDEFYVTATKGNNGHKYEVFSKFGNLYLRHL